MGIFRIVLISLLIGFAASLGVVQTAVAGEMALRNDIVRNLQNILLSRQFSEFDRVIGRYLQNKERTPSGMWKLNLVDVAIDSAFSADESSDQFWSEMEQLASAWTAQQPQSANSHIAYATMLMRRGWSYRGIGYGNTVAPTDLKRFHVYIEKARVYLERNRDVVISDPRFYASMIEIAGLQDWEDKKYSDLAMEGIAAFPDYYFIYQVTAFYLLPKWHGNADAVEAFAQYATTKAPADEAASVYLRIYWYVFSNQFEDRLFLDSKADWPLMRKGMLEISARYPEPYNLNMFARFGCLARDRQFTADMFTRLNGTTDVSNWNNGALREQCREWANAS